MPSDSTPLSPARLTGGLLIWFIVAVFYGLDYLQHTVPTVLITPLSQSLQTDYVTIANIMNVYFPVYAISQIPAGYLIDRFGLRASLSIACLIISVGLLLMNTNTLLLLLIGRIAIAIGSAFAFIGGLKTASRYLPESWFPLMTGILQTIGVMGGLVGQVYIDHLIQVLSWQTTLTWISCFGIMWSLLLALSLRPHRATLPHLDPKHRIMPTLRSILACRYLWLLALYAGLTVGAVMSTFAETFGVILLDNLHTLSHHQATWINGLIFIGVGVGAPLHGLIVLAFQRRATWLIICCLSTTTVLWLIPFSIHHAASMVLLGTLYFLLGFFVVSMLLAFTLAKRYYALEQQGLVFAFINTFIGLCGFIIPFLFGDLIRYMNTHHLSLLTSINYLIIPMIMSFIISLFIYRQEVNNQ